MSTRVARCFSSIFLAAGLLLALGSCGRKPTGKPRVAVSIFPLYDIARRVAGDRLDVALILPPGRSEHSYDPTPKEMAKVANARLGVFVGLGMDDWAKRIVAGASPGASTLELAPLADPRPVELEAVGEEHEEEGEHHEEGEKHEEEEHHDHERGALDPHFWMDPVRMQKAVDALAAEFARLDPEGAEEYRTRAGQVKAQLAEVDAAVTARSKQWTKKTIVTFHGSMAYFAARYGLSIAAIVEPFPGREPTPKYMGEVLAAIKASSAAALFSEPQLDKGPAKVIADQAGVPLFELDPVGGTDGRDTYEKLLLHNAGVLDKALK